MGAGLVTALGFPYFARFIPEGESGRYTGLFFSVRAIATAAALPLAGLAIELSGSYRSLLLLGGAAVVALIPLGVAERGARSRARPPRVATRPPRRSDPLPRVRLPRARGLADAGAGRPRRGRGRRLLTAARR